MFKKCKVVMLPTNKVAKLYIKGTLKLGSNCTHSTGQHLYILSDEEIKKGDWVINNLDKKFGKALRLLNKGEIKDKEYFKIIATTDELENNQLPNPSGQMYLPRPSQSFIEKYVEEYNKGNIITEVMVEYNEMNPTIIGLDQTPQLKINPKDNTITIRKIKDSWSREEVIVKCLKMQHDYSKFCSDSHYPPNMREIAEWTDKWIEENL